MTFVQPFKDEAQIYLIKDPSRTAQKTLFISVIKTNHLVLYRAKVAICSEKNTKYTNTVWQDVNFLNVESVGTSHNH